MDLTSWLSSSESPPTLNRAKRYNQQNIPVMTECDFWGQIIKDMWLPPYSLLDHLPGGKPAAMLWAHSSSPVEWPTCQGAEASSQQPASGELPSWKWTIPPQPSLQMTADPSDLWLWPLKRPLARTTQLSCSQIPNLQKLREIINGWNCIRPLILGVICYAVLDN